MLYSKLYQGHAYESYNYGDISDLEALTLEDLKAFYKAEFTQAKLNVGISGAMSDAAKAKLLKDLSTLPEGSEKRLTIADAPKLEGRHATIVEKPAKSTAVSFGSRLIRFVAIKIGRHFG
ncbi:peptidase M16 family protein [Pseudoalteromonas piratica]|uniref:hypothetical protein n=1 Tax=Pseudoalteromonas piratica TaxID=1348114 RepID=UPI000B2AA84B|nr:hypothetical protein [Pseudoalteromonas piratica]